MKRISNKMIFIVNFDEILFKLIERAETFCSFQTFIHYFIWLYYHFSYGFNSLYGIIEHCLTRLMKGKYLMICIIIMSARI
jgi:hypothetical protein